MKKAEQKSRPEFRRWTRLHLLVVILLGILAYSNTLEVPFLLDDVPNVTLNPIIQSPGYFTSPSEAGALPLYRSFKSRYFGYLSFAVNYALHGLRVEGYHLANVFIHILNAVLVYLLVIFTFRTPFLKESVLKENAGIIALVSAMFFVAHPVQTEAVTYIAQRFTSLAAMFSLLAIVSYIQFSLSRRKGRAYAFYAFSLLFIFMAMKTKETAFTLPLAIVLYEFIFFNGRTGRRLRVLAPVLMLMAVIPLSALNMGYSPGEMLSEMQNLTETADISAWGYLLTEFRVLVTYLRLLLWPVNQNLFYDYRLTGSIAEPSVAVSLLELMMLLSLGVYLLWRSNRGEPSLRLVTFGIFWFLLSLAVESTIIPLHPIFEHRLYLSAAGFIIAATAGLAGAVRLKAKGLNAVFLLLASAAVVMAGGTYARNTAWYSRVGLWTDVVSKAPEVAGGHYGLGVAYSEELGLNGWAAREFSDAIELRPDYPDAHNRLGLIYLNAGKLEGAKEHFNAALEKEPRFVSALFNLGLVNLYSGEVDKTVENLQQVLALDPSLAQAHFVLGLLYREKGDTGKAIFHLEEAVESEPSNVNALHSLGIVYKESGEPEKAREYLDKADLLGYKEAVQTGKEED